MNSDRPGRRAESDPQDADAADITSFFAPCGVGSPSTRARVQTWLDKTALPATQHTYAGTSNNRPRTLMRHPARVARAEVELRKVLRNLSGTAFIQREVSPFSGGRREREVIANADFTIYDFDDALMWKPHTAYNRFWSKADTCTTAVAGANRVIAGSDILAEWAKGLNSDVRVIPTCVEPEAYGLKDNYEIGTTPRLVWIGTPGPEQNLGLLAESLARVNAEFGARLTVISRSAASLGPMDQFVDRVEWRPGIDAELKEFDIAVAPLRDLPVERGKCAYKVLQYAAAGLPTVASPVGTNGPVARRLGILTATDTESWTNALADLLSASAADRVAMGSQARLAVEESYSYSAWRSTWLEAVSPS